MNDILGRVAVIFAIIFLGIAVLVTVPWWPTSHGRGSMQQSATDFCTIHKNDPNNFPGCVVQAPADITYFTAPPSKLPPPLPASGDHVSLMRQAGITDFVNASYIFSHESGWEAQRFNDACLAAYGAPLAWDHCAYGVCQSLPADKMAAFGSDWRTNIITQLKWCNSYAITRYGSWAAARAFWDRTDPRPVAGHWW